jgi:hypothetical protein
VLSSELDPAEIRFIW